MYRFPQFPRVFLLFSSPSFRLELSEMLRKNKIQYPADLFDFRPHLNFVSKNLHLTSPLFNQNLTPDRWEFSTSEDREYNTFNILKIYSKMRYLFPVLVHHRGRLKGNKPTKKRQQYYQQLHLGSMLLASVLRQQNETFINSVSHVHGPSFIFW